MRVSHLVLSVATLAAVPVLATAANTATVVNAAPFNSVELRSGGEVVVRYGAAPRVTMVEGDARFTHFTVERGGNLRIETTCHRNNNCPHDYRLRVEITMPQFTAVAVSEGGSLRTEGAFRQNKIVAAVNEGGIVDVRSVAASNVTAAVNQGGRVWVTATGSLTAAVNEGGHISYWGNPTSVTKAIHDGGAIDRGDGRTDQALAAPRPPRPPHAPAALPALSGADGHYEVEINVDEDDDDEDDDDE